MVADALKFVHPGMKLSKLATAKIVKIATPLKKRLEHLSPRDALVDFYGRSSQLVKHSLLEAKRCRPGEETNAILDYLISELVELSGNCAADKNRVTIQPKDINEALISDSELERLKGYAN